MKAICFVLLAFLVLTPKLYSGTITFKDGTRISEAEIVSIKEGRIVIRKDKKERTFDLKSIESFYGTDLGDSASSIPGEFADYKVNISEIKMPERGEDSKGKTEICEIKYTITRTTSETDRIKVPYFYLYVLTRSGGDGDRDIYRYYHPNNAKIKGKTYDEAAILKNVNAFDRKTIHLDEARTNNSLKNMGDREIKFELNEIGKRQIIAYRLEVWGNSERIAEKTWKSMDFKVSERWWERSVE